MYIHPRGTCGNIPILQQKCVCDGKKAGKHTLRKLNNKSFKQRQHVERFDNISFLGEMHVLFKINWTFDVEINFGDALTLDVKGFRKKRV